MKERQMKIEITNHIGIACEYVPASDFSGSAVQLSIPREGEDSWTEGEPSRSFSIPYDHKYNDLCTMAASYIAERSGLIPIAKTQSKCDSGGCDILLYPWFGKGDINNFAIMRKFFSKEIARELEEEAKEGELRRLDGEELAQKVSDAHYAECFPKVGELPEAEGAVNTDCPTHRVEGNVSDKLTKLGLLTDIHGNPLPSEEEEEEEESGTEVAEAREGCIHEEEDERPKMPYITDPYGDGESRQAEEGGAA
tara:strand:+ start:5982 stop:6737 length:756 start_codon:yes stop_codon:yes gene_type:complete